MSEDLSRRRSGPTHRPLPASRSAFGPAIRKWAFAAALGAALAIGGQAAEAKTPAKPPAKTAQKQSSHRQAAAKPRAGKQTFAQVGQASWYDYRGQNARRTASGQKPDDKALTAAHLSLPFNSKVKVTNLRNGRSVVVTINDRGPFHNGRIIDLNRRAAQKIGLTAAGVAKVRIEMAEAPAAAAKS